ncbi:MAG: hypothetical protein B6U85_07020 [Desulfurococcales archaeon ex4484_42]|nr:MAG: hypothetical protein B6U85_07020 [Desulfurococcales archaeon ex4484_42]
MLKASRDAVYYVGKGGREFIVEVLRTPDGKAFVALHMTFNGKYEKGEEEKEWNLLELEQFREIRDVKVDYMSLPPDVRRAISMVLR